MPVPFRVITCVPPVASSVKVRVAVSALCSRRRESDPHRATRARLELRHIAAAIIGVVKREIGLVGATDSRTAENVTAAVPVFLMDTRSPARPSLLPFAPLLWPTTTEPEFIGDAGVNPMVLDSATPVPVSDTVAVATEPVTVSLSVSAAAEAGVIAALHIAGAPGSDSEWECRAVVSSMPRSCRCRSYSF